MPTDVHIPVNKLNLVEKYNHLKCAMKMIFTFMQIGVL